jgi:hypothetical protein
MNIGGNRNPFPDGFVSAWQGSWGSNHVSAFVEDRTTGATHAFGDPDAAFPLASVAKVLIMAGTLEAVQDGQRSIDAVGSLLGRMIRVSDNAAAQTLWNQLGGSAAVNVLADRWGLPGTIATPGRGFGGTLSTAADQVHLVKGLIGTDQSPLTDVALRLHARSLMTAVDRTQAWGTSAGVEPGWMVALKNGWYPTGPADLGPTGRWRVNSLGMVWDRTVGDRRARQYLADLRDRHRGDRGDQCPGGVRALAAPDLALDAVDPEPAHSHR